MKKVIIIYEILMFILVIVSLFFAFPEDERFALSDRIIWFIFLLDYSLRLIRSENKWIYVKKHPLELISIIPFDSIFRAARLVRIFRVIRLVGMGSRFLKPIYSILKTNGLDKLLMVAIILLFIVPIPIVLVEPSIETFSDALWWAVVTITTVGYGDISPATPIGRVLAVVLMLVGIGIIGTFTSAITSYFSKQKELPHDKKILELIHSIEEIENLTKEDVELIQLYMNRKLNY